MKILYIDCAMGAAGDMLTAALLELLPEGMQQPGTLPEGTQQTGTLQEGTQPADTLPEGTQQAGTLQEGTQPARKLSGGTAQTQKLPSRDEFIRRLNGLGIPGVVFAAQPSVKCGIKGTHMAVTVKGEEEGCPDGLDEAGGYAGHGDSCEYDCQYTVHDHGHGNHETDGLHHAHEIHEADGQYHAYEIHEADGQYHVHEIHEADGQHHTHHHACLHDIEHIIRDHLSLPSKVQDDVMAIYKIIAEAESQVHGVPVTDIHFHEVGTMDAIADIAAVCLLMHEISPDRVVVSPIHVGSGQVRCAHGILPVPAPATAWILKDVPIYGGTIKGELCTPTGAAILRHVADAFGPMPAMKTSAIGCGMGKKDFEAANCVRAILGESTEAAQAYAEGEAGIAAGTCAADPAGARDTVSELRCNLDDMTGEEIGFAMDKLLEAGALDVYTVPIGMKKSRPGVMLCVLCGPQDEDRMAQLLLRHTTTIGVRKESCSRWVLGREIITRETPFGPVRAKRCTGYGVEKEKLEYGDLVRLAGEQDLSLRELKALLKKARDSGIK